MALVEELEPNEVATEEFDVVEDRTIYTANFDGGYTSFAKSTTLPLHAPTKH